MKKLIVFICLLLLTSASLSVFVFASVNGARDKIEYVERALYGDRASAYGAVINAAYEHSDNLFWQSELSIGKENAVTSSYDFSYLVKTVGSGPKYSGIEIHSSFYYDWDIANEEYASGLSKAYKEIYDATPKGTERTVTVMLKDYYDYYPVSVSMSVPGFLYRNFDSIERPNDSIAKKEIIRAFNDFFKIPINENAKFEMTVDRDPSDGHSSTSVQATMYNLFSQCVMGESICYISITNTNTDGTKADMSLIPGGYGIYAINYGEEFEYGIDLASLHTVYSINEAEEVTKMILREDKNEFFVFTTDENKSYMYVIDLNGFKTLQKAELPFHVYNLWEEEEYFLLKGTEEIAVIDKDENGYYRTAFIAKTAHYINDTFEVLYPYAAINYDGEKLITVDFMREGRFNALEICSYYVAVYDKSGLIYYGEYDCSLSANPNVNNYAYNCLPSTQIPLTVKWSK